MSCPGKSFVSLLGVHSSNNSRIVGMIATKRRWSALADEPGGAEAGGERAVDRALVAFFVCRFPREVDGVLDWFGQGGFRFQTANRDRSEERRVGKECRSRW